MRLVVTGIARTDIADSATFIAKDTLDAALRFLNAVDTTTDLIKTTPGVGSKKFVAGEQMRMWMVKGFPKYLIFYTESRTEIRILRVIHSSRDYKNVLSNRGD